jgi:hypothetical protein
METAFACGELQTGVRRMRTEAELQTASELADAKLGVAEELSWPLAMLAAAAVHLAWGYWWVTVPLAAAAYYVATYKYRRESAIAEERYYKVAGLGKYVGKGKSDA